MCSDRASPFGIRVLTSTALAALLLTGCGQGDPGEPGPAGPPGVIVVGTPTKVQATITAARFGTTPEVDFTVTDQNGQAFASITTSWLEFTIAKLVPGTDGDADAWQSYVNRTETPSIGPGTTTMVQATSDSGGTLTNHGDGSYTYKFGTDLTAVSSPLAVSYQPTLTHRIAMRVGLSGSTIPPINVTYDVVPSTGATTGLAARDIVATASCNECHGTLALHGGRRIEAKMCVTCHNPGSADADSGNTVDFTVMVHKIHMGHDLPSVVGGGDYQIWGYNDSLHDFGEEVHYPQDQRNCTKCHDGADAATPQADNWQTRPTMEACGACHDDVDFALGVAGGHEGGAVTNNADCTVCHADGRVAGSVAESHLDPIMVEAAKYQFNLISISGGTPGTAPTVTYSVTNPQTNLAYALTDPAIANGSLNARYGWSTTDYSNYGFGTATSAPASAPSTDLRSGATNNGDGTYTKTLSTVIPVGTVGSGGVAMEGRMAVDVTGPAGIPDGTRDRIPVESDVKYFAITDATAVKRRAVVEVANCKQCHGTLNGLVLHGSSRSDNVEDCVLCHNPNNTDLAQRPADPDGTDNEVNIAALDGLEEQAIDFKNLIHGIHSAQFREEPLVVYGYGASAFETEHIHFPGVLEDCETCHKAGTYMPTEPVAGRLGTTVDSQATVLQRSPSLAFTPLGTNTNPADDGNRSPTVAACAGCHDGQTAATHMILNGGSETALQSTLDSAPTETCVICHGTGRMADVKVVHGVGN
jgi:OmcA/MtrC family decaheme c-type cytochrome